MGNMGLYRYIWGFVGFRGFSSDLFGVAGLGFRIQGRQCNNGAVDPYSSSNILPKSTGLSIFNCISYSLLWNHGSF